MAEHNLIHQTIMNPTELQPSTSSSSQPNDEILLRSSSTPSSSIITSTHSSPPNKIFINAHHYQLLMQGSIDGVKQEVENDNFDVARLVQESDQSTVLHVAASVGQSDSMIRFLVSTCPDLLCTTNSKGDLPVHVAARSGHLAVAKTLIALAERFSDPQENNITIMMLAKENGDKNTCLHIALENKQRKMAEELFGKCPQVFYQVNDIRISPLYLAIKAGFWDLVKDMLKERNVGDCDSQEELLKGKSIVHAVLIAKNTEILKVILAEYSELVCEDSVTDEKGRRALSCAAYIGYVDGVEAILNEKNQAGEYNFRHEAFKRDNDGSFPIHMACKGGNIQVIKELFKLSERMKWLLNDQGQSIMHVAAASGRAAVVEHLMKQPKLATMVNMKDVDGDTPLHLAVRGKHPKVVYALSTHAMIELSLLNNKGSTVLDIAEDYRDVPSFEERLIWLSLKYVGAPKASNDSKQNTEQEIINLSTTTILPVHTVPDHHQLENLLIPYPKIRKNKYKDRLNTLLIIATLVATVTYASGFTVPGGYNNANPGEGMATLAHRLAFQVFVISNTIAMHSAILTIVILIWAHLEDLRLMLMSLDVALPLLGLALTMMSVSFTAGFYVVLHLHHLLWLRILVMVIGGVFAGVLLVFFVPLFSPMSCMKYKILRYVFVVPFKLMLLASKECKSATFY